MTDKDIARLLEAAAISNNFAAKSAELTAMWLSAGLDAGAVEPILRFMETHPSLDYGMPGALVHFVERFYGKGYESQLVQSVARRPTSLTAWMLNRLVNGQRSPEAKQAFVAALEQARLNPSADNNTVQLIERFLKLHRGNESRWSGEP